ncbi:uncharacterized protein PEZ65_003739 [Lycodopsis pacificus]
MYFCKGVCSKESVLIQTASKRSAVTRRGRYGMEASGGDRAFSVTIKRLQRTDAGTYHCGVEGTLNVLHHEVKLMVLDAHRIHSSLSCYPKASAVPLGSPPSTTPLQTEAETLPQGSSASGTEPSAAASTLPEDKTNQTAATNLKDTTVVIIVSVSLALLVCAIIPLIFYRHWWSNAEGQNKGEPEYCEENADVASTQAAVRLQSLDADPESGIHNSSQFASVY